MNYITKAVTHVSNRNLPRLYPIVGGTGSNLNTSFTPESSDDIFNFRTADGDFPNTLPLSEHSFSVAAGVTRADGFEIIIRHENIEVDLAGTQNAIDAALMTAGLDTVLEIEASLDGFMTVVYTIEILPGVTLNPTSLVNISWYAVSAQDFSNIGEQVVIPFEVLGGAEAERNTCTHIVHIEAPEEGETQNPALELAAKNGELIWAEADPKSFVGENPKLVVDTCSLVLGVSNPWSRQVLYTYQPAPSSACGDTQTPAPQRVLLEVWDEGEVDIPSLQPGIAVSFSNFFINSDECCAPKDSEVTVILGLQSGVVGEDAVNPDRNELKLTIQDPDGEYVNPIEAPFANNDAAINTNYYDSVSLPDSLEAVHGLFKLFQTQGEAFDQTTNPGSTPPSPSGPTTYYDSVNLGDLSFMANKLGTYRAEVEYVNTCGRKVTATTTLDVCTSFTIERSSDCGKIVVTNIFAGNTIYLQLESYNMDTQEWELEPLAPGGTYGDFFLQISPQSSRTIELTDQTFYRAFVVETEPDISGQTQQDLNNNYFVEILEDTEIDSSQERTFLNDCLLQNCFTDLLRKMLCFQEDECDEEVYLRFLGNYNTFMALYAEIMNHVNRIRNYDVYYDLQRRGDEVLEVTKMVEAALNICDNCDTNKTYGNRVTEKDCGC